MKKIITAFALMATVLTPAHAAPRNPSWLSHAVFYQIYPSSFMDSNDDGIGDLRGIQSRLGYLKQLGITAIWLNPIFESGWFDGGYDVIDFYKVDPRFGSNSDLVSLVSAAHAEGLKVCLDLVAGHTSNRCAWFQQSATGASDDCPLALGTATSSSGMFEFWWKCFYEEVYRTSNVIQNIDKVPDMSESEKERDKAECCFLRAWAYARANAFWRGVPIYTEPVEYGKATKPRSSEEEVWKQVIDDCTAAINCASLPDKYSTSDANYGRVTKGAAYYLRGQAYLWLKDYAKAEGDFRAITKMGYSLYPDYKAMFKAANEKNDEYIFQYQYTDDSGLGNWLSQCFGNRVTVDNAWNNYIPNPKFVDSYTWANGKPFDMDEVIPGYSKMDPKKRSVYFLRDSLGQDTKALKDNYKKGYEQMKEYGSDMDKYLPYGNEARIKKVYEGRDPRMSYNFILPYSGYVGGCTANNYTYYLRWPYFGSDNSYPFDLRTDTNDKYYYMWRKFVIEGRESKTIWDSDIDIPVFRYAGAVLMRAEAHVRNGESGQADLDAIRRRVGMPSRPATLTNILRERRLELMWEGWRRNDLIRFGLFHKAYDIRPQLDGEASAYTTVFPIPAKVIDLNGNLKQNKGYK